MRSPTCYLPAALAVMLCMAVPSASAQKVPEGVQLLRDVEYGKGGGRSLKEPGLAITIL